MGGEESQEIQAVRSSLEAETNCSTERIIKLQQLANLLLNQEDSIFLDSLDEAIGLKYEALQLTPPRQQQASDFIELASLNYERYCDSFVGKKSGAPFLDESIRLQRGVIRLLDEKEGAVWLKDLGNMLLSRYYRTSLVLELDKSIRETETYESHSLTTLDPLKDLEEAISVTKRATGMLDNDDPVRATWLLDLGDLIGLRYKEGRVMGDLEASIHMTRQAQTLIKGTKVSTQLSSLLISRYLEKGITSDIEEAIDLANQAVDDGTPDERFFSLGLLANAFFQFYIKTNEIHHLEEALDCSNECVQAAKGCFEEIGAYNQRYEMLYERYRNGEDVLDLEKMVKVARLKMTAFFSDSLLTWSWERTVEDWWYQRVNTRAHSSDIKRAIKYPACIQINGSSQVASLEDLATPLYLRYQTEGMTKDLLEAVDTMRHLSILLARPTHLLTLGSYLIQLYEETHDSEIADEATHISLQLDNDPECQAGSLECQYLSYKASELSLRFRTSGNLDNLKESFRARERLKELIKHDPQHQSGVFYNLGLDYCRLFSNSQLPSDLNKALGYYNEAYSLMPEDDINRGHCLRGYSFCYLQRYKITESPDDLNKAVCIGREAVEASFSGTYMRERILNDVATALYQRYLMCGDRSDLDEAIVLGRQAVDLKSQDHINSCLAFLSLAAMLCELQTLPNVEESDIRLGEALDLVREARRAGESYDKPHPNLAWIVCYCQPTDFILLPGITGEEVRTRIMKSRDILKTSHSMSCVDRLKCSSDLVIMLSYSLFYEDLADMDIDEAVRLGQEALDMARETGPPEAIGWHSCVLSFALGSRFTITQNARDLIDSLYFSKETFNIAADNDTHRPFYLMVYALGLYSRYSGTGRLLDLHECIEIGLQAWNISSKGKAAGDIYNQAFCSSAIARFLTDKYRREGQATDLKRVFEFRQIAGNRLSVLGQHEFTCFYSRFMGSSNANHVSESGPMQTLQPTYHDILDCPSRLYNLSVELFRYYSHNQELPILSSAISHCQSSVNSTPRQHQARPARLELLGRCFEACYRKLKASDAAIDEGRAASPQYMNNLNGALDSLQEVINTSSPENPVWFSALHLIGPLYSDRYRISGDISDLKMSLIVLRESAKATKRETGLLSDRLRLLGAAIMDNFALFGRQEDIESAKEIIWEAVSVIPQECASRTGCLLDLAEVYQADHRKGSRWQSLETSLELFQEAQRILSSHNSHTQHDEYSRKLFSGRGLSYVEMLKITRAPTYFPKAIHSLTEALNLPTASAPEFVSHLTDLASAYIAGYRTQKDTSYLNASSKNLVDAAHTVESMSSATNSIRAKLLLTIGNCYRSKYNVAKLASDLESTISFLERALELSPLDTTGDLLMLISIARSLISALEISQDWEKAYNVANRAVPLIATATPRFLDISESQFLLSKYSNLASDGAALALSANREPMDAIEILEAGRGVAMLALNELRSEATSLTIILNTQQIEEFVRMQNDLQGESLDRAPFEDMNMVGENLKKAARRIRAGQQLNDFIHKQHSRNQMAFTDRITISHLDQASLSGYIIVVNVSYRCDAFLIKGALVRAIPLPELSREEIQEKVNEGVFTSQKVLEWLWDTVAGPVLEKLGFTGPPPRDNPWPRIWWIPTGPLSKFPLHAAGRHMEKRSFNSVIDRAISSYTSSIRLLERIVNRRDRHEKKQSEGKSQAQQALIVSMEHTPDSGRPLPYAAQEAQVVADACKLMSVKIVQRSQCTKESVLRDLQRSNIFHFAGHGYTDLNDPSQSHLRLQDWKRNPLTVADLFAINLRDKEPFMAYLGACGTGQIQDSRHLDESVHLISACQLAGFRHLIGTVCQVHDKTCVDVARITYSTIQSKGITDESVSEGLHLAVRELRDRWRQDQQGPTWEVTIPEPKSENDATRVQDTGEMAKEKEFEIALRDASDYESDEDDEKIPLQWAPYVHYGC